MKEQVSRDENRALLTISPPRREGGSVLAGCAIGCGALLALAIVAVLILWWWLLAPMPIPKPQSAMLPGAQTFAVARLDPDNKAVLGLIQRIVEESSPNIGPEAPRAPWPVRWLLGADEPVQIARKFMPIQIVFSDAPKEHQTGVVLSAGRGRGLSAFLQRALRAKANEEGQKDNFVLYEGRAIGRGKGDGEAWWLTVEGSSFCASNNVDGVKVLIGSLEKAGAEAGSDIAKLYPSLSEGGAAVCGASSDPVKIQQLAAWILSSQGRPAPVRLQGVSRGTFTLSLTEQMTLRAAVELTCVNAEAAQGVKKGLEAALMPKELAKQIALVRPPLTHDEKVYLDFDVPEFDKLIIAFIKEKQAEQKAQAPVAAPKAETPAAKKEEKPAPAPAVKEKKPEAVKSVAPEAKKEAAPAKGTAPPAAPKKDEKKAVPATGAVK